MEGNDPEFRCVLCVIPFFSVLLQQGWRTQFSSSCRCSSCSNPFVHWYNQRKEWNQQTETDSCNGIPTEICLFRSDPEQELLKFYPHPLCLSLSLFDFNLTSAPPSSSWSSSSDEERKRRKDFPLILVSASAAPSSLSSDSANIRRETEDREKRCSFGHLN